MNSVMSNGLKYFKRANIWKSSTGNVKFYPVEVSAYSYDHWCFVKQIKGKVVFNNYSYSVTTSGHQRAVRQLLRDLGIKIDLTVSMRSSLTQLETNGLAPLYSSVFNLQTENKRRGVRQTTVKYNLERIEELKGQIKVLRSLGAKISKSQLSDLKTRVLENETFRLKDLAERREANREARALAKSILANSFINV